MGGLLGGGLKSTHALTDAHDGFLRDVQYVILDCAGRLLSPAKVVDAAQVDHAPTFVCEQDEDKSMWPVTVGTVKKSIDTVVAM